MKWDEERHNHLINLIKQHGKKWGVVSKHMSKRFDEPISYDQVRARWRLNKNTIEDMPTKGFEEEFEIDEKGTHKLKTLLELTPEEKRTPNDVLRKCGYEPSEWKLHKVKFSEWHHLNKTMNEPKTLYAGNLEVNPRENGFNIDELLNIIHEETPPIEINAYIPNAITYLNIPLADQHFGIADYDYYKPTQERIIHLIQKQHEEILFILGHDLLHVDNFNNTTASGREIQQIDIIKAWEDAKLFYYPLFEHALDNANKVKIMYIRGNHSESMEWAFIQMLKTRFPQIEFDDTLKERKVTMLGENLVASTHGAKKKMQTVSENIAVEFPIEWSRAKTRTVYCGHLHHEKVIDKGGIIVRQLPTGAKVDTWHDEMGYTTAHKRFQVHQYTYESEDCIYYV